QKIGLAPPREVQKATEAYLAAEDAITTWIDECCELDVDAWTSRGALFLSWTGWAQRAGETVGSQKSFVQKLEVLRFLEPHRQRPDFNPSGNPQRGFKGIRLAQN